MNCNEYLECFSHDVPIDREDVSMVVQQPQWNDVSA